MLQELEKRHVHDSSMHTLTQLNTQSCTHTHTRNVWRVLNLWVCLRDAGFVIHHDERHNATQYCRSHSQAMVVVARNNTWPQRLHKHVIREYVSNAPCMRHHIDTAIGASIHPQNRLTCACSRLVSAPSTSMPVGSSVALMPHACSTV